MKLNKQCLAVVTGAASGMGLAVSEALSAAGVRVAMLDINQDDLMKQSERLGATPYVCNVADEGQINRVFEDIALMEEDCRIAVNCAGIAPAKRMVGREGAMPLDDFKWVIEVNLIGTFNMMRKATELMMKLAPLADSTERGVVINTASIAAFEGQIGQTAYSASKGGIVSMTLPAAREFAKFGIRVNTVAPGLVATPLLENMPQEVQASLAASVPFPKRLAKPEEFASLVLHMIDNQMMNGETVRLDGALRMQ